MNSLAPYQILSAEQANKLRDAASDNLSRRVALELGLLCGLRVSEMVSLRWKPHPEYAKAAEKGPVGWIVGDTGDTLEVYSKSRRVRNGKKQREPRYIPIPKPLIKMLNVHRTLQGERGCPLVNVLEQRKGKPYTTRAVELWVKDMAYYARLDPRFSVHDLRHTAATDLLRTSRNNIRLVQEYLGHASINTTSLYLHISMGEMREAVQEMCK